MPDKPDNLTDDRITNVGGSAIGDLPTSKDDLGFGPYVQAVGAFLASDDTLPPLTLSVEGRWGSGKSSFMLQLEACLKAIPGKRVKTVWFNAWRYDRDDELWAAFAVEFTNKLAAGFPLWRRLYLHFKLGVLRFDWRRGWRWALTYAITGLLFALLTIYAIKDVLAGHLPLTGVAEHLPAKPDDLIWTFLVGSGYVGYAFAGVALIRKLTDLVGNPLKNQLAVYLRDPRYETRTAFLDSFHADFKLLTKTYAEGCRIYVFVDDLDRCEIPKAAELMQAINLLVSESTPVFYILGLDRQKVAAGLAAKYEKLLPYLESGNTKESGITFGYTFLEKFIQIPFSLPQPTDTDIDRLLDSLNKPADQAANTASQQPLPPVVAGLLVKLGRDSDDVRAIVKMTALALDHNPRRIKQFINLFRLRALLASQTGLFGEPRALTGFSSLTFPQLGKLVAITLRWPLLLADIAANPPLLGYLQGRAWKETPVDAALEYWTRDPNVMALIGYADAATNRRHFDLRLVDMDRFLQVSPFVPRRANSERHTEPTRNDAVGATPIQAARGAHDEVDDSDSGTTAESRPRREEASKKAELSSGAGETIKSRQSAIRPRKLK